LAVLPDAGDAAARLRGIGLLCAALIAFALLDSAAKYAMRSLPAIEVVWARFVFHGLSAVLMLRPWRSFRPYRGIRLVAQVVRAVFLFLSTIFNFFALESLRLDQTTTINFASAFVVAALAGPLLGEWIGPRRWAAIAVGFAGVLVVIRPGTSAFEPAMLFSLGSVLANSAYILLTRRLSATDSVESMLLVIGIVPSLMLAPAALPVFVWPPTVLVAAAMIATGICGAVGHLMLIHAYRLAPAPVLAPFTYSQLVWMVGAGYLFFGQTPDGITLLGAAIIIASGLYILYRERVHGDR
jgi:drug/metabolite transporter (DMT)-like permease